MEKRNLQYYGFRENLVSPDTHHSFFDFTNEEGRVALEALARDATEDLVTWMSSGGEVAVLDATNGTRERRGWIRSRLEQAGIRVVFIEATQALYELPVGDQQDGIF